MSLVGRSLRSVSYKSIFSEHAEKNTGHNSIKLHIFAKMNEKNEKKKKNSRFSGCYCYFCCCRQPEVGNHLICPCATGSLVLRCSSCVFWSPAAVAGAADMFPSGRPLCLLFLYFFFFFFGLANFNAQHLIRANELRVKLC